jgi:4-aminobutyrate aminotransferase
VTAPVETPITHQFEPGEPQSIPGPRARALVERDGRVLAPCAGRVYPLVIERGQGCTVWDVDGNSYLDMNAGIAVLAAGHSHPRLVRAIQEQAARFTHMAGTDFYNEPMIRAAEKLVSLMPGGQGWQVFFTNSGTEAVEASIKLARYVTGRQNIIAFYSAFHGRSYGSLSFTASKPYQRQGFAPLLPGAFHAFFANPYRTPLGVAPEQTTAACLQFIEQTLFSTTCPADEVAAIMVEPIQGEGGYVVPTPGFMAGLRDLCDRHGILLICDEVQSGVGRTGKMWGFEHEGIVPDIVASAKGLGGGMPIGALIGREELTRRWKPGAHGNTYGGNGVTCAAAYETLCLVEEQLMANAARVGAHLLEGLRAMQRRLPQMGDVRGRGLMVGVEFIKDDGSREPARFLANAIMEEAFRRGLLLLTCGASTIRFCPPLLITEDEVDQGLTIFEEAVRACV